MATTQIVDGRTTEKKQERRFSVGDQQVAAVQKETLPAFIQGNQHNARQTGHADKRLAEGQEKISRWEMDVPLMRNGRQPTRRITVRSLTPPRPAPRTASFAGLAGEPRELGYAIESSSTRQNRFYWADDRDAYLPGLRTKAVPLSVLRESFCKGILGGVGDDDKTERDSLSVSSSSFCTTDVDELGSGTVGDDLDRLFVPLANEHIEVVFDFNSLFAPPIHSAISENSVDDVHDEAMRSVPREHDHAGEGAIIKQKKVVVEKREEEGREGMVESSRLLKKGGGWWGFWEDVADCLAFRPTAVRIL